MLGSILSGSEDVIFHFDNTPMDSVIRGPARSHHTGFQTWVCLSLRSMAQMADLEYRDNLQWSWPCEQKE